MIRLAARGGFAVALLTAAVGTAVHAQSGPAEVDYWDRKAGKLVTTVKGEIKPGPAGYEFLTTGAKAPIILHPADIVRVVPESLPGGIDRSTILTLANQERDTKDPKALPGALAGYVKLKADKGSDPKARQYLDYKIAMLTARIADDAEGSGEAEKAARQKAADLLDQYLADHPTGWELWPVARTAARLQLELGRPQKAGAEWAQITRKETDLPPDVRQEATLQEIDAMIRARAWPEAMAKAKELAGATGAARERLAVYELAAKAGTAPDPTTGVKPIEDLIAKTKDPVVRATGYEMIGELYLYGKKPRDAMWSYLWVEVVYNQDKDEVMKALLRLADIFAEQGDEERVKAYRDKIRRLATSS